MPSDAPKEFDPLMASIKKVLDAIESGAAQQALADAAQGLRAQYDDFAPLCRRAHVIKDPEQQP